MKIRYVTGNLLSADETVIVHGCNARGAYASGVAGVIRREWPFAYDAYRKAYGDRKCDFFPGEVIWAFDVDGDMTRIVGNLITQHDYGQEPGRVYVSYDAVRMAFRTVNDFIASTQDGIVQIANITPLGAVAMPLIGTKLGGGLWEIISEIIERESTCFEPVVYTLDGKIPV